MRAEFTSSNGRLKFIVEGATPKDVWKELAGIQDVFDAEQRCGCCQSDDIHYRHRVVTKDKKSYDYYELTCMAYNARFAFGQSTDQVNLFPKRRDADGAALPNGGWSKYNPNSAAGQEEEVHHRTQTPAGPIGNELPGWLDRIDRDRNVNLPRILQMLMERFEEIGKGPAYNEIVDRFDQKFAKRPPNTEDCKNLVSDLHAAWKRYEGGKR